MTAPKPPPRAPIYGDAEAHDWTPRQCALNLLTTLADWCASPREFKGDATGRIWHFMGDYDDRAQLLYTSNQGNGRIELFITADHWVCAEFFVVDDFKLRVWIEDPYEEKEFWPDGADGVTPPGGDPPGRISKRGAWLQIRCADFPNLRAMESYWSVEDAE